MKCCRWLSLFSIDAVLVALVWQETLSRASAVHLSWQERALLGISVWMVYIADHLLDSFVSTSPAFQNINKAPRHYFVRKHRLVFTSMLCAAALIDFLLLPQLSFSLVLAGSGLGFLTLLYLALNASLLAAGSWPQGKEIAISLIFTLGCGLVPLVETEKPLALLCSMLALFLLSQINCTLIARLEREVVVESLLIKLLPFSTSLLFTIPFLLVATYWCHAPSIIAAFLWSLIGLSLIPKIAKHFDYETASIATDGALILGGIISWLI